MSEFQYSILLGVLRLFQILSLIGTLVIPVFYGDKILKPARNYMDTRGLSFKRKFYRISQDGWLFIACVFVSVILTWIITLVENKQSEKKATQNFENILQIKLDAKDSINKKDAEIRALTSQKQVGYVQKSVDSANLKLTSKSFQYENLSTKLQMANLQNTELQKELNSPVIEQCGGADCEINPSLIYDSLKKRYIFGVAYINIGKGQAEKIESTFSLFDIYGKYISTTGNTYGDTSSVLAEHALMERMFFEDENLQRKYIVFHLTYKNHFGKIHEPFIRVYWFDTSFTNKHLPLVTTYEADVIKNKYKDLLAQPFYKLQ